MYNSNYGNVDQVLHNNSNCWYKFILIMLKPFIEKQLKCIINKINLNYLSVSKSQQNYDRFSE